MKKESVKLNIVLNMFRTYLNLIFPIITFPYILRVLTPVYYGKISFSNSYVNYFLMIAALGIANYGIREVAKVRNDNDRLNNLVTELLIINLLSTILSYLLLFVSFIFINKIHDYKLLILIYSFNILLTTIGAEWFFQALEEYKYITLRSIIFQTISLALIFTFVNDKQDYIKYAIIITFSTSGSGLINFLRLKKNISFCKFKSINIRKHLKSIFILFFSAIAAFIYSSLDTVMLGFITNDYQVGIYSASVKIVRIVLSVITSISVVIMPRITASISMKDHKMHKDLVIKSMNLSLMLSIPASIGLIILSKPIVLLFSGQDFFDAITIMRMISLLILFIPVSVFYAGQVCIPNNLERLGIIPPVVGAIVNLTLNILLIPKFLATGAAIASIIAEFIVMLIHYYLFHRYIETINIYNRIFQYLISAIIMTIFVILVLYFIKNIAIALILGVLIGLLSYGSSLFLLKNEYALSILNWKK